MHDVAPAPSASVPSTSVVAPVPVATPLCTLIDCDDELVIAFSPRFTTPGSYSFAFDLDGVRSQCPMKRTVQGMFVHGTEPACGPLYSSSDRSGFANAVWVASPRRVAVEVERDGKRVASARADPDYAVERPNGPDCPPLCQLARITVTVDRP